MLKLYLWFQRRKENQSIPCLLVEHFKPNNVSKLNVH